MDRLIAFIVDEGNWMPLSMTIASLSTFLLLYSVRNFDFARRHKILLAMNLFFGITIGMMSIGHFSAVTARHFLGNLKAPLGKLYLIGILLFIPSWWLVVHTIKTRLSAQNGSRFYVVLNGWLAITLVALGIHNLPIAAPAVFNIAYNLHSRRSVGWLIVSLAIVLNIGLFIGSLLFMASGQNFEEFSRMK